MIEATFATMIIVGLAELGDKTQLMVIALAARYNRPLPIFAGVMAAFLLIDGIAVALGGTVTRFVSPETIKTIAGIIFIIFGILILKGDADESRLGLKDGKRGPFASAFLLTTVMEMGDKTQIAAALLATKHEPLFVLIGALIALGIVTGMGVYVGHKVSDRIPKEKVKILAGAVFILFGLISLSGLY